MDEYKEVDYIFSKLSSHVVESRSLIEHPYRDDDVLIEGQILEILDDGMEVELCLWTECALHMSFWDVSIDKEQFDSKINETFLEYLKNKGLYLENIRDKYGRWKYCGIIEKEDVYRIQYYEMDDD